MTALLLLTLPVELLLHTALYLRPEELTNLLLSSTHLQHTLLSSSRRLITPQLLCHTATSPRYIRLLHTLLSHYPLPPLPAKLHPLHTAAKHGNLPALRLLTSKFDPATRNAQRLTPLEVAAKAGQSGCVAYLLTFTPVAATTLNNALILTESPDVAARLMEAGRIDPSVPLPEHMASPLQIAARKGQAAKVEVLVRGVKRRGGVDERDVEGWTALHWAVWGGWGEVVRLLVGAGADAGARTDAGEGVEVLGGAAMDVFVPTAVGVAA